MNYESIKTRTEQYAIDGVLRTDNSKLEEIINHRQEQFCKESKYQEVSGNIRNFVNNLYDLLPDKKREINELTDNIVNLECICYSAAYRDGIADLMTAMTFNELSLTHAQYIEFNAEPNTI